MKRDLVLEQQMEDENSKKLNLLHRQTREMNSAARHMHGEIRTSSAVIENIHRAVDTGKTGMRKTVAKFEEVLTDKNSRLSIYVAGFIIVFFVIAWKFFLIQ